MRAEYANGRDVRRLRWQVWGLGALLLVAVLWLLTAKILRVSEARAVSATRENIAASLSALAVEHMARGQMLEASWLRRNPFELLSWPSEDYCGELSEGEPPRRGCWHYLPARGWLLHRSRFTDAGQGMDGQLQVFQLRAVPQLSSTGPQSPGRFISMELDRVPAAEVAALAQAYR